jgi:hypothetical protein
MKRTALLALCLALLAGGTVPAAAQRDARPTPPSLTPRPGLSREPAPAPHAPSPPRGELECRNCHEAKHQGVARMYLGLGGRGTPMIPSHMFQVRVQCVACHIVPKESDRSEAAIVGRTFRPTEQACIGCHGEKYRGMLGRWVETLAKMRAVIEPKLAAARAALAEAEAPAKADAPAKVGAKDAKRARARELVDDADFNLRFVALAKGVHNVFYAADLLKLSNGWLDEALPLLGKPPLKSDDRLVRGGYCAVLCHEQAGVKLPATVTFGKQKIPHARHVAEFGAVCTACHSAEVHKTVTATAATCTACHHSPANERCEACHRAQSAFYRGEVKSDLGKLEPNVMVNAVTCTGCHDMAKKHSRQAVADKCVSCHDAAYTSFLAEWTAGVDGEIAKKSAALARAQAALARNRKGPATAEAEALVRQARNALTLVRKARAVHNPGGASALLDAAETALAQAARR